MLQGGLRPGKNGPQIGRLAQLARAFGLHPKGRGSEPLSGHKPAIINCKCQVSQGGHGACLKNTICWFDSNTWHKNLLLVGPPLIYNVRYD